MKTDDYKQELRLSATLHGRNAKKNIFCVQKTSANRLRSFAIFSEFSRKVEKILARQIAPKKRPLA